MPYFTTEELRALPDLDDVTQFPDARLAEAHDWIVSIIERECDTSFVHRSVTERLSGACAPGLILSDPYVVSVESVSVDGTALAVPDVDGLFIESGILYRSTYWWPNTARGNVAVTYTAGYSATPPPDLKQAALRAARNWVLTMDAWSGVDTRATGISNADGNITLSVAGEDRPTGLPDVDATIMAWARRVRVPKVS